MRTGTVFENNRTQAVRLPLDLRFAPDVKHVLVRKLGKVGHDRSPCSSRCAVAIQDDVGALYLVLPMPFGG